MFHTHDQEEIDFSMDLWLRTKKFTDQIESCNYEPPLYKARLLDVIEPSTEISADYSLENSDQSSNNGNKITKYFQKRHQVRGQPQNEIQESSRLQNELIEVKRKLMQTNSLLQVCQKEKCQKTKECERVLLELEESQIIYRKTMEKNRKMISELALQLEDSKRQELKVQINLKKQRLGELVIKRNGLKLEEVWSDGTEIHSLKEKLNQIKRQIEELKRTIKTESEHKESHQRLGSKLWILDKQACSIRESLDFLETEKVQLYVDMKRQLLESQSLYGRNNKWPCLSDRYQILSLLGRGGFSEVYKAIDLDNLTNVACKIHQLNTSMSEANKCAYTRHVNREADVHKKLKHPNIVSLYNLINIDQNSFATILEYCEGPDLGSFLKQHKQIEEIEAKTIIEQIIAGLHYMDSQPERIIHYDLKPENLIFNKGEIKISDFGLCKVIPEDTESIELTSQGLGTYWYLPPECFHSDQDPIMVNNKIDMWSLGVIYYQMLYGVRPFGQGLTPGKIIENQVILKVTKVTFPDQPIISNETKDFISRCLTVDQSQRIDISEAYRLFYGKD